MSNKSEYFKSDYIITGKHARLVDDLWVQNKVQESFFKRLVDIYTIAPIIGLRMKRTAPSDNSEDGKRTVQLAQIMTRYDELSTIMRMVLLLDETTKMSVEDKIDRTFKGPRNQEEFEANVELFNSYVRGGIEVLHEELVQRGLGIDDEYTDVKIGNIVAFLENPLMGEII